MYIAFCSEDIGLSGCRCHQNQSGILRTQTNEGIEIVLGSQTFRCRLSGGRQPWSFIEINNLQARRKVLIIGPAITVIHMGLIGLAIRSGHN